MRVPWFHSWAGVSMVSTILVLPPAPSKAQAPGIGGSLGGYGAMAGGSGSAMIAGSAPGSGMGSGSVAPFGGRFGAAAPSSMGGGGAVSYRPRPSSAMSGSRPALTLGPMGGGMSGGMGTGMGSRRRPFNLQDLGSSGGLGLGGVMRRPMPAATGVGVMPPNFGSPFRQPPSLLTPTAPGAGMSM